MSKQVTVEILDLTSHDLDRDTRTGTLTVRVVDRQGKRPRSSSLSLQWQDALELTQKLVAVLSHHGIDIPENPDWPRPRTTLPILTVRNSS